MKCARAGCRKKFVPKVPWQKFCSGSCKTADWIARNYGPGEINRLRARVAELEAELQGIKSRKKERT